MYPEVKDQIVQLYLDDIIPNRFQPREIFDEKALKELAVSIKEHGVIQPIIVRNVNGKYEIIAGERRYKASALAGLTKIPAIIRDLDDKESSKVALLENLQRKNLNPIEEARTYQKILELDQMTQEELAKTMGKSQSAVANKIRLLSLPDEIQDSLLKEQISERHARTLLNVSDANQQKELLKKVINTKMSVRALEEEIKEKYKNQEQTEAIPEISAPTEILTPSSSAYVNNSPLMPTAELPKDESNYGKVTISPPIENQKDSTQEIINYGELGKEKEEEEPQIEESNNTTEQIVDIDKIKENSMDINSRQSGGADLDSLLNLGNPTSSVPSNQFITPAEKIVKTDTGITDIVDRNSDYFKMPEFSVGGSQSGPKNLSDNNMFLSSMNEDDDTEDTGFFAPKSTEPKNFMQPLAAEENYTVDSATEKIRDLVKDLKVHGVKVNADEMNFEKSYQIIIKIDKTEK